MAWKRSSVRIRYAPPQSHRRKHRRFFVTTFGYMIQFKVLMLTSRRHGFTIVELAIVIAVIGILAALGTVGYKGVTTRAANTQSSKDASNVSDKLELYFVKNKKFPSSLNDLGSLELASGTAVNGYDSNDISYCLVVGNSASGTKKYTIRDNQKLSEGDCSNWTPTAAQTGGSTPPPAPSTVSVSFTAGLLRYGDYRYYITVSGGTCSVGSREVKMGVTAGSSPSWSSWPWQTSDTRTQDVQADGIYSPVDTTIYAKARCTDSSSGLSTESNTAQTYNGSGGGAGGAI